MTRVTTLFLAFAALQAPAVAQTAPKDFSAVSAQEFFLAARDSISISGTSSDYSVDVRCVTFTFNADSPNRSSAAHLISRTWDETCARSAAGAACAPPKRLIAKDEADVAVFIPFRQIPGQRERFHVCLRGKQLNLSVLNSPFKYDTAYKDGLFTLSRKP